MHIRLQGRKNKIGLLGVVFAFFSSDDHHVCRFSLYDRERKQGINMYMYLYKYVCRFS